MGNRFASKCKSSRRFSGRFSLPAYPLLFPLALPGGVGLFSSEKDRIFIQAAEGLSSSPESWQEHFQPVFSAGDASGSARSAAAVKSRAFSEAALDGRARLARLSSLG